MIALQVERLSKRFGGLLATSDVSFDVAEHSLTALIGPNGAGKTTLFNLITNLFQPDSGRVVFHGQDLRGRAPGAIARLGLIRTFQTARVFPGMTVLENVLCGRHRLLRQTLAAHMAWLPAARREERRIAEQAMALLDLVGLADAAARPATELPMGAQKLLEVMRALMAQPRLLLLDEPAAGLNDTETAELATLLRAVRDCGVTVMVVEHNMSLVMTIADQVVVLETGAVIATGTPAEIQANPRVIAAYLGEAPV
jgi:branched-chain amino acid transport system ATP-binding protein